MIHALDITYLDLWADLRAAAKTERFYIPLDRHWDAAGHRVATSIGR